MRVKTIRQNQVVPSDRSALIDAANTLVSNMIFKQIGPSAMSSCPGEIELDANERTAYNAALEFLSNTLKSGPINHSYYASHIEDETEVDGNAAPTPIQPEEKRTSLQQLVEIALGCKVAGDFKICVDAKGNPVAENDDSRIGFLLFRLTSN